VNIRGSTALTYTLEHTSGGNAEIRTIIIRNIANKAQTSLLRFWLPFIIYPQRLINRKHRFVTKFMYGSYTMLALPF